MDKKILRRLQLTQLEIAKEFKRICEENNLTYMMEAGTLLGAVRHKGFIPWDDDMDFSMPRDDYDRFFRIAQKMDSAYEPVRWDITPKYPHPFGKFVKKGTIYKERKMDESYGIYIDIFPWDHLPDNEKIVRKYKYELMIYRAIVRAKCGCKTYRGEGKLSITKLMKNTPFIVSSFFFKEKKAKEKYDRLATSCNNVNTLNITVQGDEVPTIWSFKKELFSSMVELKFEDTSFSAPRDWDGFLTKMYGNYMQLPPEKERGNQHMAEKIDFGG